MVCVPRKFYSAFKKVSSVLSHIRSSEDMSSKDDAIHSLSRRSKGKKTQRIISSIRGETFDKVCNMLRLGRWGKFGYIAYPDVQKIRGNHLHPETKICTENVVTIFFSRILANDNEAVSVFKHLTAYECTQGDAHGGRTGISCRDAIFAIIHSCDPFVRQALLSHMYMSNLAVPVLLPSPLNVDKLEYLIWGLRRLRKKVFDKNDVKEYSVVHHPVLAIGIVRFGEMSLSKSSILNHVIKKSQNLESNHSFYLNDHGDVNDSHLSKGCVEAIWFSPNAMFDREEEICFLNLRGSADDYKNAPQEEFIYKFSSYLIAFVDKSLCSNYRAKISKVANMNDVAVILTSGKHTEEPRKKSLKLITDDNINVIDCAGMSEEDIADLMLRIVLPLSKTKGKKSLSGDGISLCNSLGIAIDSQNKECLYGENVAKNLLNKIKHLHPLLHNKKVSLLSSDDVKYYFSELKGASLTKLEYCLHWFNILFHETVSFTNDETMDDERRAHHFERQLEEKNTIDFTNARSQGSIKPLALNKMSGNNGFQHLFRELRKYYLSSTDKETQINDKCANEIGFLTTQAMELFIRGYPMEIFSDDSPNDLNAWSKMIIRKLKIKLAGRRLLTVSMFHMDGNHKENSKVLHYLFGMRATATSLCCFEGITVYLVRVDEPLTERLGCDFLLILDQHISSNLPALDGEATDFDNRLTLLAFGLSKLRLLVVENFCDVYSILSEPITILKKGSNPSLYMCIQTEPSSIRSQILKSQHFRERSFHSIKEANELDALTNYSIKKGHLANEAVLCRLSDAQPHKSQPVTYGNQHRKKEKILILKERILQCIENTPTHSLNPQDFSSLVDRVSKSISQYLHRLGTESSIEITQFKDFCATYYNLTSQIFHKSTLVWMLKTKLLLSTTDRKLLKRYHLQCNTELLKIIALHKKTVANGIDNYVDKVSNEFVQSHKQHFLEHLETYSNTMHTNMIRIFGEEDFQKDGEGLNSHHTANSTEYLLTSNDTKQTKTLLENQWSICFENYKKICEESYHITKILKTLQQIAEERECFDIVKMHLDDKPLTTFSTSFPEVVTIFANLLITSFTPYHESEKVLEENIFSDLENVLEEDKKNVRNTKLCKFAPVCLLVGPIPDDAFYSDDETTSQPDNNSQTAIRFRGQKYQKSLQTENRPLGNIVRISKKSGSDEYSLGIINKAYEYSNSDSSTGKIKLLQNFTVTVSVRNGHSECDINLKSCSNDVIKIADKLIFNFVDLLTKPDQQDFWELSSGKHLMFSCVAFKIQELIRIHYLKQVIEEPEYCKTVFGEERFNRSFFADRIKRIRSSIPQRINRLIRTGHHDIRGVFSPITLEKFEENISVKISSTEGPDMLSKRSYQKLLEKVVKFVEKEKKKSRSSQKRREIEENAYKKLFETLESHALWNLYKRWKVVTRDKRFEKLWDIESIADCINRQIETRIPGLQLTVDTRMACLPWHILQIEHLDLELIANFAQVMEPKEYELTLKEISLFKSKFALCEVEKWSCDYERLMKKFLSSLGTKITVSGAQDAVIMLNITSWLVREYVRQILKRIKKDEILDNIEEAIIGLKKCHRNLHLMLVTDYPEILK